MTFFTHKNFFIVLALFALFPFVASASEIRLEASKVEVRTGEQFVVTAFMSADESLNAVEGRLVFPQDLLSVKEIRDGNSVINFWIEKPHEESNGVIVFSGVTPGGFSGVNSRLFSVVFEAKREGITAISLEKVKALRNDGAGTEEPLTFLGVDIGIKPGDSNTRKEVLEDTIPPEPFTPTITFDSSLFDNKWFLVFATQDKGSGIARYEVKEFRFAFLSFLSPWTRAESPHVLKDQKLKSRVVVKAIDNAGNERMAIIAPRYPLSWYDYVSVIGILGAVIALCVFIFKMVWRKK